MKQKKLTKKQLKAIAAQQTEETNKKEQQLVSNKPKNNGQQLRTKRKKEKKTANKQEDKIFKLDIFVEILPEYENITGPLNLSDILFSIEEDFEDEPGIISVNIMVDSNKKGLLGRCEILSYSDTLVQKVIYTTYSWEFPENLYFIKIDLNGTTLRDNRNVVQKEIAKLMDKYRAQCPDIHKEIVEKAIYETSTRNQLTSINLYPLELNLEWTDEMNELYDLETMAEFLNLTDNKSDVEESDDEYNIEEINDEKETTEITDDISDEEYDISDELITSLDINDSLQEVICPIPCDNDVIFINKKTNEQLRIPIDTLEKLYHELNKILKSHMTDDEAKFNQSFTHDDYVNMLNFIGNVLGYKRVWIDNTKFLKRKKGKGSNSVYRRAKNNGKQGKMKEITNTTCDLLVNLYEIISNIRSILFVFIFLFSFFIAYRKNKTSVVN